MVRCPLFSTNDRHARVAVPSGPLGGRLEEDGSDVLRGEERTVAAPDVVRGDHADKDAASPPRFATPFMTFAAEPAGTVRGLDESGGGGGGGGGGEDESAVEDVGGFGVGSGSAVARAHREEFSDVLVRVHGEAPAGLVDAAGGEHAGGERATSSRRTRMSLTGSPRPTTRPGGAGALTSTARFGSAPARSTAGAAPRSTASTTAPETAAASPTIEEDAIAAVTPATSSAVVAPSVARARARHLARRGLGRRADDAGRPGGAAPALDEELPATTRPAGTETRCIALNPDARTGGDAESMRRGGHACDSDARAARARTPRGAFYPHARFLLVASRARRGAGRKGELLADADSPEDDCHSRCVRAR